MMLKSEACRKSVHRKFLVEVILELNHIYNIAENNISVERDQHW